jgi:hypothetical protein
MGILRHRPHGSNVAVVSLLRNKNGGETLILKKKYSLRTIQISNPKLRTQFIGRYIGFNYIEGTKGKIISICRTGLECY